MTHDFWLGLSAGVLIGAFIAALLFVWAAYATKAAASRAAALDLSFLIGGDRG